MEAKGEIPSLSVSLVQSRNTGFVRKNSADGLISLQWYKEGKIDQIVEYCKQDVAVTRDLFLFGQENGFVRYETRAGKIVELPVDWKLEQLL